LGLSLAGAGIATYGFAAQRPTFEGIGLGCAAVGIPFLIIDTYNNGRAGWYTDQVKRFDPSLQLQTGSGRHPWGLGLTIAY
jgi:hypothetical protein